MNLDDPRYNAETAFYDDIPFPSSSANLKSNRLVDNNYSLIERIGKGGMGEVWSAYDETAERTVVLKFISEKIKNVPGIIETVRGSFKKIHALQHQHICPYYGLSRDAENGLYMIMKFIDGITLDVYRGKVMRDLAAAKSGTGDSAVRSGLTLPVPVPAAGTLDDENLLFPFDDAVQIFGDVAEALDYAHAKKVIHRDIKPQNIMISPTDGVQVIDFGLAEEILTISRFNQVDIDISNKVVAGTRLYMSPEQWRGKYQDAMADQYALAVTIYELFCGRLPFFGTDVAVLRECVLHEEPEPIPGLPDYANAAICRALSKKREDRFENCKTFIDTLAATFSSASGISKPRPVRHRYISRFALSRRLYSTFGSQASQSSRRELGTDSTKPMENNPGIDSSVRIKKDDSSRSLFIAILITSLIFAVIVALLFLLESFSKPVHDPWTNTAKPPESTQPVNPLLHP
ncbi:hypothetical protein FACS189419_08640 [Planctomycetales bacterium]|nr:hypothetical protein FACS189419_08640 [Planctomycetales bacterium]